MLTWPAELPQEPLQDGFSRGVGDPRLRSQNSAGPPKVRRRSSASVKPLSVAFMVSVDEAARIERFFEEDTIGGTAPFLIPNAMVDGLTLLDGDGLPLTDDSGTPLLATAYDVVMFGEKAPTMDPMGGPWFRASFDLVVMP